MKSLLPLLSLLVIFASCTTAYKSGQTPDDVYYSPARPQEEYVRVREKDDRQYRNDEEYYDDRYLRMKVRNRRWSTLDDGFGYYSYNPYYYSYRNNYLYYNSPWSNYNYWNHYYNPYYRNVIVLNPKSPVYSKPRTSNLHVFDRNGLSNNPKATRGFGNSGRSSNSGYNNNNGSNYRGSNSNAGSWLRESMGSSRNNNSGSNSGSTARPGTSSGSSSSGSSSSGSSGSGSAPVRRF